MTRKSLTFREPHTSCHCVEQIMQPCSPELNAPSIAHVQSKCSNVKMQYVSRTLQAEHKDIIHDVSFDFHGKRMATCSSDQSVKVT